MPAEGQHLARSRRWLAFLRPGPITVLMLQSDPQTRYTEICSVRELRCPGCMLTFAGKILPRREYVLVSCFNRRRGESCGQQSLIEPLGGDRGRVIELSASEAVQIRNDHRRPLADLLRLLGVPPLVRLPARKRP
jgi:hypothetical protein